MFISGTSAADAAAVVASAVSVVVVEVEELQLPRSKAAITAEKVDSAVFFIKSDLGLSRTWGITSSKMLTAILYLLFMVASQLEKVHTHGFFNYMYVT